MQKFNYETKRWGITPITNKYTDFQGLELDFFVEDISSMDISSKWKVVDLGCGGGNIAAFLKNKFKNWQITGIDISRDVIKLASAKFPQIKFECASAEKIPGGRGSLDLIYAFDTLEHFENLKTVLASVKDKLHIGGVFYAAIPLEKQFPSLYWLLFKLGWRGKFSHLPSERSSMTVTRHPSRRSLSVKCEPINPAPPVTNMFLYFIFCNLKCYWKEARTFFIPSFKLTLQRTGLLQEIPAE